MKFAQFEKAVYLLENAPNDISDSMLFESGLSREDLEKVNEGLLKDIFGGLFGKLKEKILKSIPGSVLKKVDAILSEYKEVENNIYKKTQKERDKIFKANADDKDSDRNKEQIKRSEKAIEAIEAASKSKKDAMEEKLKLISRNHGDIVVNYIKMQLLQVQEDVADQKLKDAEKFASEDELDKLEKEVRDIKKKKQDQAKMIEDAQIKDEEKRDKDANDPKNAKKGQVWKTIKGNNVTILSLTHQVNKNGKELGELNPNTIYVKGESGATQALEKKNLKSLIK